MTSRKTLFLILLSLDYYSPWDRTDAVITTLLFDAILYICNIIHIHTYIHTYYTYIIHIEGEMEFFVLLYF